ncbi:hypothetical protein [Myroides sp.]|uniref:hypothetical protein n=1 Tax=Myroides sp. TaxID=1874736 RepID=UPI003F2BCE38
MNNSEFGLIDDQSLSNNPAYTSFLDKEKWHLDIHNPFRKDVQYKAIDNCIDIFRTGRYNLDDVNRNPNDFSSDSVGNELIKRCEGFLFKENEFVVFIEIKVRTYGKWLKDAREKFEETILSFKEHYPNKVDLIINPIVSNKAHYSVHQNLMVQNRILKDKTELPLEIIIIGGPNSRKIPSFFLIP